MTHLMNHTAGFQETTWDVGVLDQKDIISFGDAELLFSQRTAHRHFDRCGYLFSLVSSFVMGGIYHVFHLFEEALGNFPKWMYEHKWITYHITYEYCLDYQ